MLFLEFIFYFFYYIFQLVVTLKNNFILSFQIAKELLIFHKIANQLTNFYKRPEITNETENNGSIRDSNESRFGAGARDSHESFQKESEYSSSMRNSTIIAKHLVYDSNEPDYRYRTRVRFSTDQLRLRTLPSTVRKLKSEVVETTRDTAGLIRTRLQTKTESVQLKTRQLRLKNLVSEMQSTLSSTTTLPPETNEKSATSMTDWFFKKFIPKAKRGKKRLSYKRRQELRDRALLEQFRQYEDPRIAQFLFNEQFRYLAPRRGGFIWPGNAQPRFLIPERNLPRQVIPKTTDENELAVTEQEVLDTLSRR